MRVLVEIVHPADVLFFIRPIECLRARGDSVLVVSRQKDVACKLLDELGLDHQIVSHSATGLIGLAGELFRRDVALTRVAHHFRPHVMIGIGGVAISHAGRLLSIPAISFYDSENAWLQNWVTWPFITHLYVPESYAGVTPKGRTTRIRGVKELSFFHPVAFRADRRVAVANGFDPERDNFLVRLVAWHANHDLGKRGWSPDTVRKVIAYLAQFGKVHISSERALPNDLEALRYCGRSVDIHHLMAYCRILVGESATMASEAAMAAVPAIYAGHDFPGYVHALASEGLIAEVKSLAADPICAAINAMLLRPPAAYVEIRNAFVATCPDWSEEVVRALDRHAKR